MKRIIWLASVVCSIFFYSTASTARCHILFTQRSNDTFSEDSLDRLTNEELEAYLDSVYRAGHPKLDTIHEDVIGKNTTPRLKRTSVFSYSNSYVPSSVSVSTTNAVGQIDIEPGMSPSGAKTYIIPINSYKHDGVFSPDISLSYNSQGGASYAGKGWSLGGLQMITRGAKTHYFDGAPSGIMMKPDDAFYLNGIRLIRTSATAYEYETEQGNVKVTATVSGNVTSIFHVYYPNGYKATFGLSTSNSNYLEYPMTSQTDERGRTITYDYEYSGHYLIKTITYDNNVAKIQFAYNQGRSNYSYGYCAGINIADNRLLTTITCSRYNTVLGTYTLAYSSSDIPAILKEIGYSANGKSLNPLKFYYGDGSASDAFNTTTVTYKDAYKYDHRNQVVAVRGRFDYASRSDALFVYPSETPYFLVSSGNRNYFSNKYDENQSIYSYLHFGENSSNDLSSFKLGKNFINLLMADLEGNLSEYLVKISNAVVGDNDRITFLVYRYNSNSNGMQLYKNHTFDLSTVCKDKAGNKSITPKFYYAGDFNGDGKAEVMAVSANSPITGSYPTTCYIFDLISGKKLYEERLFCFHKEFPTSGDLSGPENRSDKLIPIDYDGDGKMELCHIHENGISIYSFSSPNGIWQGSRVATSGTPNRASFNNTFYSLGEFNGDGLPDIIVSPTHGSTSSKWTVYNSKGDGNFGITSFYGPKVKDYPDFIVQDINGDGLTDLIELTETQMKPHKVWENTADAAAAVITTLPSKNELVVPVRFNTSSLSTQLVGINGNKACLYSYLTNQRTDQALTGMVNSYGVIDKNYYYSIAKDGYGIYTFGTYKANFPYSNIHEEIPVLAGNEIFLKGKSIDVNKFFYTNAVMHRQGLGFRGFEKIRAQNKRGQNTTTTYDPYRFCQVEEVDGPASKTTYNNSVTVASNKIRQATLTSRTDYDKLKVITATTNYTYDSYGQVLTASTTLPGSITVSKTYTYNNYTNTASKYHLGVPATSSVTTKRGSSQHVKSTAFTSYNKYDQPLTILNKVNGNTVRTTANVYDSNGNLTSQSVKPYSATTARTYTYTYVAGNRMDKATDPAGVYKSYTYNTDGTVSKVTTATGTTEYSYDAFGRTTQEKRPDGTTVSTGLSWDSGNGGLYAVTKSETGMPSVIMVYDGLNREVKKLEKRFDGTTLMSYKDYDDYGNLSVESHPYKNTVSSACQYTYDSYNRLTKKSDAGKTFSYTYSGLSTTVSDGTMSTTTTTDALGGVVSVTDPTGTIAYTLNGAGNSTKIITPSSNGTTTTTIGYDAYGRRISVADPSHGTTTYTYDNEGRLKQENNANGKIVSYTYDNCDRVTKMTTPEFSTNYTYDNRLNVLTAATGSNGPSTTYTYDTYGRLSSSKETAVDGKWLQKNYSYVNGRVSEIKYTSQSGVLTTENYSYANGHLAEVKLDGTTSIFKLTAENNMGQTSSVTTGSLERNYNYMALGYPTGRSVTGNSKTYQSWTYSFNVTNGNLANRRNVQNGKTESFTYDDLHRLTGFGGTSVEYDANGNITKMGDVGNFAYETPGKPFAVSEVTLTNNISVGEQNVSYTSFDRPSMITSNGYTANFTYNGDFDRVKMSLQKNGSNTLTRYYLGGCYELDVKPSGTTEKLYLNGDFYNAPAVLIKNGNTRNVYYILRDHLGSITHVVNTNGTVMQELSYDAWGRLRNPSNNALYTPTNEPEPYLGRGYCGHEHLTGLGLINMNARLYDPLLCRFLSSDPYVTLPYNTQAYNRYSYGMNNPLVNIDRDGKFVLTLGLAIGVLAGAYIGGAIANSGSKNMWNPLKWNYSNPWTYIGILAGGAIGGYAGAAFGAGNLAVGFKAVTPFCSVGLNLYNNKQDDISSNWQVNTPMGGHYDSGEEKSAKKAGDAYDNAINLMRQDYEVLTSSVSTISSSVTYYGPREYASYAEKISKVSSGAYYLDKLGFIGYNSIRKGEISVEDQREIFKTVGGGVCAWISGMIAGTAMAGLAIETGSGAYFAGMYGYGMGAYMGQQIGENLGNSTFNLWYYDYNLPMRRLKDFEDYIHSFQNSYQPPIW